MRLQTFKLAFALLAVASWARAADDEPDGREVPAKSNWESKEWTPISFDQLHSGYFDNEPPEQPLNRPFHSYSFATPFFQGAPVYRVGRNGADKVQLKSAFDRFGKVHVVDSYEKPQRLLTIAPTTERGNNQAHYVEDGLETWTKQVDFVREHFGDDAVRIAFGPPRKPARWWTKLARLRKPASFDHPTNIYKMLRILDSRRSGRLYNNDGHAKSSTLLLEVHNDGTIRPSVAGELEEAARKIHL